ncbi:MAG: hypothetical protein RI947_826 [Candidatus Parcubacteria bacterium]|jgi:hypothetical protein
MPAAGSVTVIFHLIVLLVKKIHRLAAMLLR